MFGNFGLLFNGGTYFAIYHVSCDLTWTFFSVITLIDDFELLTDEFDFIAKEE